MRYVSSLAAALIIGVAPAGAQQPGGVPHPAQGAEAPAGAFQVVRPGDNALSCEALISEMMALNTRSQQLQAAMTEQSMAISRNAMASGRGAAMGGAAMSLGGMAASFVPGASLVMGAVAAAGAATQRAQMEQQQQQQMAGAQALTESMADLGPIAQRVAHLAEISRHQSC